MKETIIIGGRAVTLSAGAGALVHYKKQFGTEYTDDYNELISLTEDDQRYNKLAETGLRLLWAMARAADSQLPTPDEWTAGFTPRELLDAIGQAREIFISSLGESSGSGEGSSFCSEKIIASALLCGLRPDDLDDMPLPMVLDTIGEWCRIKGGSDDDARPAAQEDFDAL